MVQMFQTSGVFVGFSLNYKAHLAVRNYSPQHQGFLSKCLLASTKKELLKGLHKLTIHRVEHISRRIGGKVVMRLKLKNKCGER